MSEGREVMDEVGATKESVGDWGELLETEDEDIWGCLGLGEGIEEVGREDWGIDGLTAAVEGYNIGIEGGHGAWELAWSQR